jgi:hypothetical protein
MRPAAKPGEDHVTSHLLVECAGLSKNRPLQEVVCEIRRRGFSRLASWLMVLRREDFYDLTRLIG